MARSTRNRRKIREVAHKRWPSCDRLHVCNGQRMQRIRLAPYTNKQANKQGTVAYVSFSIVGFSPVSKYVRTRIKWASFHFSALKHASIGEHSLREETKRCNVSCEKCPNFFFMCSMHNRQLLEDDTTNIGTVVWLQEKPQTPPNCFTRQRGL